MRSRTSSAKTMRRVVPPTATEMSHIIDGAGRDGEFRTQSTDRTIIDAVQLLNGLRKKQLGQYTDIRKELENISSIAQCDQQEGGKEAKSSAGAEKSSYSRSSRPSSGFKLSADAVAVKVSEIFEEKKRVEQSALVLEQLYPMEVTVVPDASSETNESAVDALRVPRAVTEGLFEDAEWLSYWGDIHKLHQAQHDLVSQIGSTKVDASIAQSRVEFLEAKLRNVASSSERLRLMMEEDRRQAMEAVEREKGRQDSLEKHNQLLSDKIVEMRRQVTLAENAMYRMKDELDVSNANTNKIKAEFDTIQTKHNIEMLALRKELTAALDPMDLVRRQRLETLEQESSRRDEMIGTLNKTIEVLNEENRRLSDRITTMKEAADLAAANGNHSARGTSPAVDTAAIQHMTARQYQKREAELLKSNSELRKELATSMEAIDSLKDRLQRQSFGSENDLMALMDRDGGKGNVQSAAASVAVATAKGKKPAAGKAPVVPQYLCGPLEFPELKGGGAALVVSATSPLGDAAIKSSLFQEPLKQLRLVPARSIPDSFMSFREVSEKLWSVVEKFVPEHPQRHATGERETIHCWLQKQIESYAGIVANSIVAVDGAARGILAKEEAERTATSESMRKVEEELRVALEEAERASTELKEAEGVSEGAAELRNLVQHLTAEADHLRSCVSVEQEAKAALVSTIEYTVQRVSAAMARLAEAIPISSAVVAENLIDDSVFPAVTPQHVRDCVRSGLLCVDRNAEALIQVFERQEALHLKAMRDSVEQATALAKSAKVEGMVPKAEFDAALSRVRAELEAEHQQLVLKLTLALEEASAAEAERLRVSDAADSLRRELNCALAKAADNDKFVAETVAANAQKALDAAQAEAVKAEVQKVRSEAIAREEELELKLQHASKTISMFKAEIAQLSQELRAAQQAIATQPAASPSTAHSTTEVHSHIRPHTASPSSCVAHQRPHTLKPLSTVAIQRQKIVHHRVPIASSQLHTAPLHNLELSVENDGGSPTYYNHPVVATTSSRPHSADLADYVKKVTIESTMRANAPSFAAACTTPRSFSPVSFFTTKGLQPPRDSKASDPQM